MNHDSLYDQALEAINALFSDTSVDKEQTAESLRSLADEINVMIHSLDE